VDRNDAAEMVRWFFPAWALMLALRHARRPAWLATRVAWFLIINAGLLSAFGIAQTLSGTQHIFWVTPLVSHFFASFGYENHAASYFALLFALAAGMLLHLLTGGRYAGSRCVSASTAHRRTAHCPPTHRLPPTDAPATAHRPLPTGAPAHRRTALVTASICAVLCLIGMALSFSRAGLALAVGLSGVALVAAARLFWPRAAISQRVAVVAALIMGLATVFFVVASMGGNPLAREADGLCRTNLEREAESRLFMVRSASRIWATEPWFGVGGWGYRHFVPVHAVVEQVAMGPGDANVHNDALQFLCEFGAVGFGLMLAATIAFAWPLLRSILRGLTPGLALAGTGLLAVLFHSLIDLPFRSPGVLYAWLAVAGVGGASVGGASVGGASVGG
jgi:O-antigen ligase